MKKKIILSVLMIFAFIVVLGLSQDKGFMSDIIAKLTGESSKNTQMPKEMQEIKAELDKIDTGINKDIESIEDNTSKLPNTSLDEKIKKMDEKLAVINKKEGIDAQTIKNDISAELKAPIKDEKIIQKLKEVDKIILNVEKNIDNLNIKGE